MHFQNPSQYVQVMFYTVVALVQDCMLLKHYVSVTGISCNVRLKISTAEHVSQARCVFILLCSSCSYLPNIGDLPV